MPKELTFSEQILSYIDTLDWELDHDLRPEERTENEKARKVISVIVDELISSREAITDNKLAGVEKLMDTAPELINDFLDERFTRNVVNAVSGYVKRTMQLSRLESGRLPSHLTNGYLREAVRTYILGLPQASVALSRAAMEQALKENLGHQGTRTFVEMRELLDEAEGAQIIDGTIRKMCRKIADEADDVLHERPTSLANAYEVLVILRGVLQHIYTAD